MKEIGSIPDAIRSYNESIALYDRIARDRPAEIACLYHLAQSHNNIGLLLRATGRPAEAVTSFRRGLEIFERLARENPSVVQYQDDLAGSYLNIGEDFADPHAAHGDHPDRCCAQGCDLSRVPASLRQRLGKMELIDHSRLPIHMSAASALEFCRESRKIHHSMISDSTRMPRLAHGSSRSNSEASWRS